LRTALHSILPHPVCGILGDPLGTTQGTLLLLVWIVLEHLSKTFEADEMVAAVMVGDSDADMVFDTVEADGTFCVGWGCDFCAQD
jgi:hypothetical protein